MLKFISSLKLAVFLIAAIAVIAILATIFPAADAFHSWTFRFLVLAFFVNLGTCTIKLLPGLWKQLHRDAEQVTENAKYTIYEVSESEIIGWLKEKKYRVSRVEQDEKIKILATKGRTGLCAPHVLHISILVILIGAMLSMTNSEGFVMGQIGQTRPFPEELGSRYTTGCYIEILDFRTEYDEKQSVDNWVTTFNVYMDDELVAEAVETKVNEPFSYDNMMIYQNSYDYRHLVEITGSTQENNNSAYGIPDNTPLSVGEDTVVVADLNGNIYLQVSDHQNPVRGQFVQPGDTLALTEDGANVTYLGTVAYTVLEMKTRTGTLVVFLGFLLAVLASLLFLSGRYREIWVLCSPDQSECSIYCHSKSPVVVEETEDLLREKWITKTEDR